MISLTTPVDEDVLRFHGMTAREEMGRLFEYQLKLQGTDMDLSLDDILGQPVTVHLALENAKATRHFNGIVTHFSQTGVHGRLVSYTATLRPWLWLLTRTSDCRIFQEKSVPDIIQQVFRDLGFTDFENELSAEYRTWEYCVQYRETDFNFVSRLMEQEGIYYYFKHTKDKHTLVLADAISSHGNFPDYEDIPYFPPDSRARREREHIYNWSISKTVQPGGYALTDFDFKKPRADLKSKYSVTRQHEYSDYEIYDYPGEYQTSADGTNYVSTRLDELQAQHERARAQATARTLATGYLFKLAGYPRTDQNREYLIVSASYDMEVTSFESGEDGEEHFDCNIVAMDSQQNFRSQRTTPKPAIQGPQTAIVVGKAGEEIWTDKYGRVKVQFHWDREGKADENSSCWIRVSSVWAGKKWGAMHIPRIGQEVIVEFLEGDPDRPIITGRVYNDDNKPPYTLPDEKTKSTIKSNTSKGGGSANELLMEDLEGKTQVVLSNAYGHKITEDEDTQSLTIETRDQHKIHLDDKNKKISIQTTNAHRIELDDTDTEGEGSISLTTTNGHSVTMDDKSKSIATHSTDGHVVLIDDENKKIEITSTGGNSIVINDEEENISVVSKNGHSFILDDSNENITLEDSQGNLVKLDTGGGKIVIEIGSGDIEISAASGKISLSAMDIEIAADNELKMSGGMSAAVEGGMEAKLSGTMTTVEASGILEVKGSLVKIN
ncbi:MAG: type VI secretion system tip protein VgrG [Gammaproteobacteria bacterium]|nr:type VI secretion system tip protein VgrG [Gammaproteobacteria bacterium]